MRDAHDLIIFDLDEQQRSDRFVRLGMRFSKLVSSLRWVTPRNTLSSFCRQPFLSHRMAQIQQTIGELSLQERTTPSSSLGIPKGCGMRKTLEGMTSLLPSWMRMAPCFGVGR